MSSTDDELAGVKDWWNRNGKPLLTGALLAGVVVLGWNTWHKYQNNQSQGASQLYQALLETSLTPTGQPDATKVAELAGKLKSEFGGTAYAQYGSLFVAKVAVESGNPVTDIAFQAPALGAQVLVFLVSLYFFLATRHQIRVGVLSMCFTRRMRWRTAHVFRDVETKVSRFLFSVTIINFCVGVAVTLAMWAAGMPSPVLWGSLAAMVNYIPYVAQAVMVTVLFVVAMGTQDDLVHVLLPVGLYLVISFSEGQLITPQVLGRTLTLNPFLVFLSIGFWIWVWGPVGGLVAVPSLLMLTSFLDHVLPRGVDREAPIRARGRARVVREAGEEIAARRRERSNRSP